MRTLTLVCCLILSQVQGDMQPKVVEKAMDVQIDGDIYKIGCTDKTRVLLHRENGEAICVSFEAINQVFTIQSNPLIAQHCWPSGTPGIKFCDFGAPRKP